MGVRTQDRRPWTKTNERVLKARVRHLSPEDGASSHEFATLSFVQENVAVFQAGFQVLIEYGGLTADIRHVSERLSHLGGWIEGGLSRERADAGVRVG